MALLWLQDLDLTPDPEHLGSGPTKGHLVITPPDGERTTRDVHVVRETYQEQIVEQGRETRRGLMALLRNDRSRRV